MLRSTCITRWRVFPQCAVIGVIASMALTPLAFAATMTPLAMPLLTRSPRSLAPMTAAITGF